MYLWCHIVYRHESPIEYPIEHNPYAVGPKDCRNYIEEAIDARLATPEAAEAEALRNAIADYYGVTPAEADVLMKRSERWVTTPPRNPADAMPSGMQPTPPPPPKKRH